jgi:hypothetical protein
VRVVFIPPRRIVRPPKIIRPFQGRIIRHAPDNLVAKLSAPPQKKSGYNRRSRKTTSLAKFPGADFFQKTGGGGGDFNFPKGQISRPLWAR